MTLTAVRPATIDHAAARRAMIDSQLRTSGVTDAAVIDAMGSIAREDFVPSAARGHAYIDRAIPLGDGKALAAPLFHGKMLSEAAAEAEDAILVVSSSGYLAALLRAMGAKPVVIDPAALREAGPGSYTLVLVDGAIETIPDWLKCHIAEDGRIVTGLIERGVTRLATGRKLGGAVSLLPLAEMGIPVLGEFAAPKRWSF